MNPIIPEEYENYAALHSAPERELLKKLRRTTHQKTTLPQMLVGHLEGTFLRLLAGLCRAKNILEIGAFTGYSALAMAEALPEDGELVTLDINAETTLIAREYWNQSPHGKKIRLVLGKALDSLANLPGPFDMVFIDADKANYRHYWDACLPKVRQGGLIVVDNVLWSGRVLAPASEDDRAIADFNDYAVKDPRVECVMLTVRDGVTLAKKK